MAAGSAARDPMEDLFEEVTCSICQEFFKDPVILECRHNFCRNCLTQGWDASGTTETSCPQCKEKVLLSNLRPNQQLAKIVGIAKKCSLKRTKRAEESERICEKHQKPLNVFCEQCNSSKEHEDQRVIPLGPPAQDYQVGMAALSAAGDTMETKTSCSVCLEYFTDPVYFKCGHSFCQSCLIQHWEKSITKETCCPLCKEKVLQKDFKPHQQTANIAETTPKLSSQGPRKAESKERVCDDKKPRKSLEEKRIQLQLQKQHWTQLTQQQWQLAQLQQLLQLARLQQHLAQMEEEEKRISRENTGDRARDSE